MDEWGIEEPIDDFWPDPFRDGKPVTVRVRALEVDIAGAPLTEEDEKAIEYFSTEEARIAMRERYTSYLDRASLDLTFDQLKIFIAHYAQYSNVATAAKTAGGSVAAFRHRRKIDPIFNEMWDLAREHWIDRLEAAGMERATVKIDDPRDYGHSNDMIKFMLKTHSEQHQDRLTIRSESVNIDAKKLTTEQLEALAKLDAELKNVGSP